jgi:hypothetical protein
LKKLFSKGLGDCLIIKPEANNNESPGKKKPQNQSLGNTIATIYQHNNIVDDLQRQYIMPRNFSFHTEVIPTTDALLRLYITDDEFIRVLNDTTCTYCSKPEDIYRTGITKYQEVNQTNEDSLLRNNQTGQYTYYPYNIVKWVPFDRGYYAEITTNSLGEFWLNDGGFSQSLPVNTDFVVFDARRLHETQAILSWSSVLDTVMATYLLQRSSDSINFTDIKTVASLKKVGANYSEIDDTTVQFGTTTFFRLFCTTIKGKTFYSPIRAVQWTKNNQLNYIYPNPTSDGVLNISWTASPGTVATLQLVDISGRVLFKTELKSSSWNNLNTLKMNELSKGVYFLNMQIAENSFVEKVTFK